MPTTFTTGDLSIRFRVPVWQILQAIKRKFLPEPQRVSHYRVWTEADLPRVRTALIAAGYLAEEEAPANA
jgi:hypothetical protein